MSNTQKCIRCGNELPLGWRYFRKCASSNNGFNSICKQCLQSRERQFYHEHCKSIRAKQKIHREKNREAILKKKLIYKQQHMDEEKARYIHYYHSENGKQKRKEWKIRNRDRIRAYHRNYCKFWLDARPGRRISHGMGILIGRALKSNKSEYHWEQLTGYTLKNLMYHLEFQFKPGMTWENYGKNGWHIDHIKPRSSFFYKCAQDQEFKQCWALSNLQPLWASQNISKGNKELAA